VTPPGEVGKSPFHVVVVFARLLPYIEIQDPGWTVLDEPYSGLIPPCLMVGPTTVKLCVTGGAAAQLAFPACGAVIEQVPAATLVTVLPEIVQTLGVVEAKLTGSSELAVAAIGKAATPIRRLLSASKAIVCAYWPPLCRFHDTARQGE